MRKILNQTVFIIALISTPVLILPSISSAAEIANCRAEIQLKLDDLLSIKDNLELTDKTKADREFESKVSLLESIISCSSSELIEIESSLKNLENLSPEDKRLRQYFLDKVSEFFEFFSAQKEIFSVAKTNPENLKELAKEIFDWRQNHYNPIIRKIVNFSFYFKQQNIIAVTETRLNKISSSLKTLISIKNKEVTELLSAAATSINAATTLNQQAYDLIKTDFTNLATSTEAILKNTVATSTPANLEISSNSSEPETVASTNQDRLESNETDIENLSVTPEPETLIKESLDKIKETYNTFFKISKAVQAILGF